MPTVQTVSANATQVVYRLEGGVEDEAACRYVIEACDVEDDKPWRFRVCSDTDEELKVQASTAQWISDVNDDFQGKLNEDPPKEFIVIMADHYQRIFAETGDEEGESAESWDDLTSRE